MTELFSSYPDPSYPRPDFDRSSRWLDLCGEWEFARGTGTWSGGRPIEDSLFTERISVPFCWESTASQIATTWLEEGWYRRTIQIPEDWHGERAVCFFAGVHHHARVFLDGWLVAEHQGSGPFESDLTEALDGRCSAQLMVGVRAPIDKSAIAHGKQRSVPAADYDSCSFRPTSGIWQPVWLEPRPATFVRHVRIESTEALAGFRVTVVAEGPRGAGAQVSLSLDGSDTTIGGSLGEDGRGEFELALRSPRRWSPTDPHLYWIRVRLESEQGVDEVSCSAGLRRIGVVGDEIHLNGRRLFLRGVLDQGYWPDTGLTAPTMEALGRDLELARDAGYNLVRKHLKIEDRRWLHLADQMGMLVWEEPPSSSRYGEASLADFRDGVTALIERDANHPSIVVWGCFNEEWGLDWRVRDDDRLQEAVADTVAMARGLDGTRLIVDNSGWSHVAGDFVDWHYYDEDLRRWRANVASFAQDLTAVIPVPLHPPAVEMKPLAVRPKAMRGLPNLNSEYGGGTTSFERGWHLRWQTQELRRHDRLSGYVYTELCDIEHEFAGVYDANRAPKDFGNFPTSDVNAETVLVLDLDPVEPGVDVITPDGHVAFEVRCSHHGESEVSGRLRFVWTPHLSLPASAGPLGNTAGKLRAAPFELSTPVLVETQLPEGWQCGRLLVWLEDDSSVLARSVIDAAIR